MYRVVRKKTLNKNINMSSYLSSFNKTVFLYLFFESIFMSLIQPLDMHQTQFRFTQFTSKVRFIKRLVNYIENYDPNIIHSLFMMVPCLSIAKF